MLPADTASKTSSPNGTEPSGANEPETAGLESAGPETAGLEPAAASCATCKFYRQPDSTCRALSPSVQVSQQTAITRTKMWGDHDGSDATSKTDFSYKAAWPEVAATDWCGEHQSAVDASGLFERIMDLLPIFLAATAGKVPDTPGADGPAAGDGEPPAASPQDGENDLQEDGADGLLDILTQIAARMPRTDKEKAKDQELLSPEILDQLAHLILPMSGLLHPKKAKAAETEKQDVTGKEK